MLDQHIRFDWAIKLLLRQRANFGILEGFLSELIKQDILELNSSQRKIFPGIESVADIFARYYIIKVNTFDDIAVDPIDEWIYFLKNSEIKDSFRAKGLQEAKEKMRRDDLRGSERVAYDLFVKDQRIRDAETESVLVDAQIKHEQQLQQALAEKEKTRCALVNMVKRLKNKGFTDEEIAEDTGLSTEEIRDILS